MRSPWQLIKDFASRRKPDEAGVSVDEAIPTSDRQVAAFEQRNAPQRELEARQATEPQSTAAGNETDPQPTSIGTDAQQPLPAVQADPLPSQVPDNVAPDRHARPAPEASAAEAKDGEKDAGSVTTGSPERRAKPVQARGSFGKRTIAKKSVEQPVATKKTALVAAIELGLEIRSLRLQLSAKLLEQNHQLRRMIERYGDS